MQDSLTNANYGDFSARYKRSIGFFIAESGRKVLVFVKEVTPNKVTFTDVNDTPYFGYADKGAVFEFIPVNRGFFNGINGEGSPLLYKMARVPARQWTRGISPSNTRLSRYDGGWEDGLDYLKELSNVFSTGLTEKELTQLAFTEYKQQRSKTMALSRHFAIANRLVHFHDAVIGRADNHMHIVLSSNLVRQELMDVNIRNGFNFRITLDE